MTTAAIKEQFDGYLPVWTNKQQELLLKIVKNFLNVDKDEIRITRKQYNKEIIDAVYANEKAFLLIDAVARIEKGNSVKNEVALKELSKW